MAWSKTGSTLYKPGSAIILESSLIPVFGVIIDIVVCHVDSCYFIVQEYITNCFVEHFHSFEVSAMTPALHRTFQMCNLADYHPLCIHTTSNNTKLISLKYYVIEQF